MKDYSEPIQLTEHQYNFIEWMLSKFDDVNQEDYDFDLSLLPTLDKESLTISGVQHIHENPALYSEIEYRFDAEQDIAWSNNWAIDNFDDEKDNVKINLSAQKLIINNIKTKMGMRKWNKFLAEWEYPDVHDSSV